MGIEFLRHIERCACLLYVIDMSQSDPYRQFETLKYELGQYRSDLPEKPFAIVANKMDTEESQSNIGEFKEQMRQSAPDLGVFEISAKYGSNISALLQYIRQHYDARSEPNQRQLSK